MLSRHDSSRLTTASSSQHGNSGNSPFPGNTSMKAWLQPRLLDTTMQLMYYQPVEPARVLAKRFYNEYVLLTATDASTREKHKASSQKTKTASTAGSRMRRSPPASSAPSFGDDGVDENRNWGTATSQALIPYGVEALSSYFMPQPNRQSSNEVRNMFATITALLHTQGQHRLHRKTPEQAELSKVPTQTCPLTTPLCHEAVDKLPLALMVRYLIALSEQELCGIVPRMVEELTVIALFMALRGLKRECARASSPLEDPPEAREVLVKVSCGEADLLSPRLRLLPASWRGLLSAHLRKAIRDHLPLMASPDVPSSGAAASSTPQDHPDTGRKASTKGVRTPCKTRRSLSKPSSATDGESILSGIASTNQKDILGKMKAEIEDLVKSRAVAAGQDSGTLNVTVSAAAAEQMLRVASVFLSAVVQVGVPMVGLLTFHSRAFWTHALQARCAKWFMDGLIEREDKEIQDGENRMPHTDVPYRKLLQDLALIVKSVDAPFGENVAGLTAEHCTSSSLANLLEKRLSAITEPTLANESAESAPNLWSEVLLWVAELVEICVYAHGQFK